MGLRSWSAFGAGARVLLALGVAATSGAAGRTHAAELRGGGACATGTLPLTTIADGVGDADLREGKRIVTSSSEYVALFGHAPPPDLDFAREWVAFYGAGARPTGGYEASIVALTRRCDGGLRMVTRLVSPGSSCFVTQAMTSPHALARFPRPDGVDARALDVVALAEERDCSAP